MARPLAVHEPIGYEGGVRDMPLAGGLAERRPMRILVDDGGRHVRATGYGRVSRSVLRALAETPEIDLTVVAPVGAPAGSDDTELPELHYVPATQAAKASFDLALRVGQPLSARAHRAPTLMYTMVDVSDVPSTWREALEPLAGILTPNRRDEATFRQYFDHVYRVPLYANRRVFKRMRRFRDEGSDKLSFVFVGTYCFRKGVDILLDAFCDEFSFDEAQLTMICTEARADPVFNGVMAAMKRRGRLSDIAVVTGALTDPWLARHYCRHDAFVSFTRGEGWGYPMLEAAMCGLPVVATRGTTVEDFLDGQDNLLVASEPMAAEAIDGEFGSGFRRAYEGNGIQHLEVSRTEARAALRQIHERRDDLEAMGQRSAERVAGQLGPDVFRQGLMEALTAFRSQTALQVQQADDHLIIGPDLPRDATAFPKSDDGRFAEVRVEGRLERFNRFEVGPAVARWIALLRPGGQLVVTARDVAAICRSRQEGRITHERFVELVYGSRQARRRYGFDAESLSALFAQHGLESVAAAELRSDDGPTIEVVGTRPQASSG